MKKLILVLIAGLCLFGPFAHGEKYVTRTVQPASDVATVTNDFAKVAVPVLIYTELTGTETNVVTVAYLPTVESTATDYGKAYRVGTFTTIGGAEVPLVLNSATDTNSIGDVVMPRGDVLKLTGAGGTDETNVFYRVVFRVD